MNQKERQKNDGLLAIVFCTLLLAYAGTNYNKTSELQFLFLEVVSAILLISSCINYIKLRKETRKIKVKKIRKPKQITPFDNIFKRNYRKTTNKYIHKQPVPDQKSAYIQSAWDELGKL